MPKIIFTLILLASVTFAQLTVEVTLPVISISASLEIALVPDVVVINQVPEPEGIVVTYESNDALALFNYHDADLKSRGWEQSKYDAKNGSYKAHYRRGKDHAKLEVSDKHGQVEVKVREGKE